MHTVQAGSRHVMICKAEAWQLELQQEQDMQHW